MKWSWKIVRILGVDVEVHISLIAMILVEILWGAHEELGASIARIAILFSIITLHEFGHIVAARQYGVEVKKVVLWIFGGAALMETMPRKPQQEFLVAIAGPLVNALLALLGWLCFLGAGVPISWSFDATWQALPGQIFWLNAWIGLFNCLPILPMDGGRMLRAVLSHWFGRYRATEIATSIALSFAVAFVLFGFARGHTLFIIFAALFYLGVKMSKRVFS